MGNVRTPKPYYFEHGVIEFYVKNGVIYYQTMLWLKDGLTQFKFETGKYDIATNNFKEIINRVKQNVSTIGVIEN